MIRKTRVLTERTFDGVELRGEHTSTRLEGKELLREYKTKKELNRHEFKRLWATWRRRLHHKQRHLILLSGLRTGLDLRKLEREG